MPATFVAVGHSAWTGTATSRTTGSITVQSGDLLVAIGGTRDGDENVSSVTGGGLTWTSQASNAASGRPTARIYTATANTNGSIAATFNFTGTIVGGGSLYAFRGGTGTANATCTQAKSQSITASTYSLAVIWIANETAEDGSTRTFDTSGGWTTYNEQTYSRNIGEWTVYGGYYSDRGNSSGADTVGLTNLGAPDTVIAAIEITGTAPPVALATTDTGTSTDTGALTVAHSLDVSDSGTSTDTGALGVNYGLAATDAGSSSDSGTLSLASEFFIITNPVVLSTSPDTVNVPRTAGPETVVRLQALDGTWEVCGVDRANKVWPENVSLTSDSWGPKTATFDLKRDPANTWPDVLAFTPVKIDVNGQLVWSGRVTETPSRDGADTVMSISCEGWQHHLDDDLTRKFYVHDNLTEWRDNRSFPNSPLGNLVASGKVEVGDGSIVMGFPKNATTSIGEGVMVTLDLGEGNSANTMVLSTQSSTFASGNFTVYGKVHDDIASSISGGTNIFSFDAANNTFIYNSIGTSGRYVSIVIYKNGGASPTTETTDRLLRIAVARVFGQASYHFSDNSNVKATNVITDVLTKCPLLSQNTDLLQTTSFNIPSYTGLEYKTPREHWNSVNSYHGWTSKVDVFRRAVYMPKPSRPKYDVGEYSAMEANDSAGSSGQEIYNKVLVTGQDPSGTPVVVARYSGSQTGTGAFTADPNLAWTNPSFDDASVAHWTVPGAGGFTRTTTVGEYDTSPAAGKLSGPTSQVSQAYMTAVGTVTPERVYEVSFKLRSTSIAAGAQYAVTLTSGAQQTILSFPATSLPTSYGSTYTMYITPKTNSPLVLNMSFYNLTGGAVSMMIDNITLSSSRKTIPDRRNFTRAFNLQMNVPLPTDGVLAASIGDAWLANHATTTFKGDVTLSGPRSLRDRISGQPIPLYNLLADTDELLYFSDRQNPDTGSVGRMARITSVTYTPSDDKAVVTLDNSRTDFETLLNRLGAT